MTSSSFICLFPAPHHVERHYFTVPKMVLKNYCLMGLLRKTSMKIFYLFYWIFHFSRLLGARPQLKDHRMQTDMTTGLPNLLSPCKKKFLIEDLLKKDAKSEIFSKINKIFSEMFFSMIHLNNNLLKLCLGQ